MTLEDVLAHQESVRAGVEAVHQEMKDFAARYPGMIEPETIADVEAHKKDLDIKIAQVNGRSGPRRRSPAAAGSRCRS